MLLDGICLNPLLLFLRLFNSNLRVCSPFNGSFYTDADLKPYRLLGCSQQSDYLGINNEYVSTKPVRGKIKEGFSGFAKQFNDNPRKALYYKCLFTSWCSLLTFKPLSRCGSRQWPECQNNTETNLTPQYTGIYRYSYNCLFISHSSSFLQHKSAYRHQKLCKFVNDALRVQRTWRSIAGEPLHAHPSDLPILCFRIQCKKYFRIG